MKIMNYDGLNNITIHQLESLIHLIRERSFTRAAKKMGLSQPALTKNIGNMENAVEVRIVNRENSGISLTPEGNLMYEYARKITGFREDLKEKYAGMFQNESGNIGIIASTIPAAYILPHVLSHFNKDYPDIRAIVRTANSDEAIEIILNGHAEIGFTGKKPMHKKIHAESVWKDRLILVVPNSLKTKDCLTAAELMKLPFVIREKGSGTRQIVEEYISAKTGVYPRFNVIAEMGSSESVKESLIAGMGASIISVYAVRRELEHKLISEQAIENWQIERDFFLIFRKKNALMRHHQLFFDFLKNADALIAAK